MSYAVAEILHALQGEGRLEAGGREPLLRDRLSHPHRRLGLQSHETLGIA